MHFLVAVVTTQLSGSEVIPELSWKSSLRRENTLVGSSRGRLPGAMKAVGDTRGSHQCPDTPSPYRPQPGGGGRTTAPGSCTSLVPGSGCLGEHVRLSTQRRASPPPGPKGNARRLPTVPDPHPHGSVEKRARVCFGKLHNFIFQEYFWENPNRHKSREPLPSKTLLLFCNGSVKTGVDLCSKSHSGPGCEL